jgi:hypothetical protein
VLFSVDDEAVNWRAECLLHRFRGVGKLDEKMAFADLSDLEAAGDEPLGYCIDVGLGRAESFAKLLWSEPLVIGSGMDVLLFFKKAREGGVLFRAAFEDHQDAA